MAIKFLLSSNALINQIYRLITIIIIYIITRVRWSPRPSQLCLSKTAPHTKKW